MTHLMLSAAAFFWGINPMIMKIGLADIDPLRYNSYRLLLAFIVSLVFIRIGAGRGTLQWKKVEKGDRKRFVILGIGGFFIFQAGYTFGVHYTAASISAIVLALLPVFVAIISIIGRTEKLSIRAALGIAISVAGVLAITFGGAEGFSTQGTYLRGVLLLVIAEFSYAGYTVYVRPLTSRYCIEQIVCIIIGVVLVPFFLVSLPTFLREGAGPFTASGLLSIAYSGTFGILVGNMLWSHGVKRIGSTGTSVYSNLTPIFGVIAGYLVLSERLFLPQMIGGAAVLAGVWVVNRRRKAG
jgi:drug/metabolite transporter (DMT)-like permease